MITDTVLWCPQATFSYCFCSSGLYWNSFDWLWLTFTFLWLELFLSNLCICGCSTALRAPSLQCQGLTSAVNLQKTWEVAKAAVSPPFSVSQVRTQVIWASCISFGPEHWIRQAAPSLNCQRPELRTGAPWNTALLRSSSCFSVRSFPKILVSKPQKPKWSVSLARTIQVCVYPLQYPILTHTYIDNQKPHALFQVCHYCVASASRPVVESTAKTQIWWKSQPLRMRWHHMGLSEIPTTLIGFKRF